DDLLAHLAKAGDAERTWTAHLRRKDGSILTVEGASRPLVFGGRPSRLAVVKDVTERTKLEEQLRQAQKMEAIGRLAGGVAHDFNNMLSVVLAYSSMLARGLAEGDPMRADLQEIEKAGERAANLTRQ